MRFLQIRSACGWMSDRRCGHFGSQLEGMEILSGSGAEITGCILNDVNVRTSESQHYMNSYRTKGETL